MIFAQMPGVLAIRDAYFFADANIFINDFHENGTLVVSCVEGLEGRKGMRGYSQLFRKQRANPKTEPKSQN